MCLFHKYKEVKVVKFENELTKFIGTDARIDASIGRGLSERGVISVVQCERCGKVKHIKTKF